MDRREALSLVGFILGGTIVGSGNFLSGCKPKERKSIFGVLDNQQIRLLEEVAETILPKTPEAPGAKEVEIGKFINTIVSDCYNEEEQKIFLEGLSNLNAFSEQNLGNQFLDLNEKQKEELISLLEKEATAHNQNSKETRQVHYYSMIKQLTLWGYFSSEQVGTKVLRHVPIPGRFEGCIPYQQGEKTYI